jgi:hypothetical protein
LMAIASTSISGSSDQNKGFAEMPRNAATSRVVRRRSATPVRSLVGSRATMRCAECGCYSARASGWIALLGRDPDHDEAPTEVIAFCPACAAFEFGMAVKLAETYE